MPDTFLEAKQQVLRFSKRPQADTDWLALAGDTINESITQLQRKMPDLHALSKVATFTYTAGSKVLTFLDADLGTEVNKIIGMERVTSLDNWTGTPMQCLTYRQLQDDRQQWYMRASPELESIRNDNVPLSQYERYVETAFTNYGVLLQTGIQVYPIPTNDVLLSVFYTPWLKQLVADDDTNLLLKYCWNFVLYSSLSKMNLFLNEDKRLSISQRLLEDNLNEVKSWDTSMNFSKPIHL